MVPAGALLEVEDRDGSFLPVYGKRTFDRDKPLTPSHGDPNTLKDCSGFAFSVWEYALVGLVVLSREDDKPAESSTQVISESSEVSDCNRGEVGRALRGEAGLACRALATINSS